MTNQQTNTVTFDTASLEEMGLKQTGAVRHGINEEFRAIKHEVLKHAFPRDRAAANKNRVLVTSVNEGDGKTFCAFNLAMSVSLEADKNVLLVDTNILSPSLHKMVAPKPKVGLLDYISEALVSTQDIIHHTDKDNLKIITVSDNNEYANECLSSNTMVELAGEFNSRYNDRLVIFDAPPLLGVNETATLAENVDQIIIVIADGKVKASDLKIIQKKIPEHVVVHYVLNKTPEGRDWQKNSQTDNNAFIETDKALTGSSALN